VLRELGFAMRRVPFDIVIAPLDPPKADWKLRPRIARAALSASNIPEITNERILVQRAEGTHSIGGW
jgi:hypothetical protein